jgi:hypothetical protein
MDEVREGDHLVSQVHVATVGVHARVEHHDAGRRPNLAGQGPVVRRERASEDTSSKKMPVTPYQSRYRVISARTSLEGRAP